MDSRVMLSVGVFLGDSTCFGGETGGRSVTMGGFSVGGTCFTSKSLSDPETSVSISDPVSVYSSSSSSESLSGFFALVGVSREVRCNGGTLEEDKDFGMDAGTTMAGDGRERAKWSNKAFMGGDEGGDEK